MDMGFDILHQEMTATEDLTLRAGELAALGCLIQTESFNGMAPEIRASTARLLGKIITEVNDLIPRALNESCPEPICRKIKRPS